MKWKKKSRLQIIQLKLRKKLNQIKIPRNEKNFK